MNGLTKESSERIGFVLACLFRQAVNMNEVKKWCYSVVENCDEYPSYILDLIDFSGSKAKMYEVIGFVPDKPVLSKDDEIALYGIAYKRGVDVFDSPVSREVALTKLEMNKIIQDDFRNIFPFIYF